MGSMVVENQEARFAAIATAPRFEEELQFHLDMDAAGGHDRRQARLRLGNVTRIEEETRAMGIIEWLDSALQDARYGLRQLRRDAGAGAGRGALAAVGLGANTAIFSLVDAAILKPLPVDDPDSLVIVEWTNDGFPPGIREPQRRVHAHRRRPASGLVGRRESVSAPRARTDGVRSADGDGRVPGCASRLPPMRLRPSKCSVQYVSSNFFQGLGAVPVIGRPFRDDEDRVGAGARRDREPSLLGEPARRRRPTRSTAASASTTLPLGSSASRPPGSSASGPASGPTSTRRSP